MPATINLSLIVPVYNEEDSLPILFNRLNKFHLDHSNKIQLEIIFVNDGSIDKSLNLLCQHIKNNAEYKAKLINFSRNFGHQAALLAGYKEARGEVIGCMDADLQDDPEHFIGMLLLWKAGHEVVYGVRSERRNEGLLKKITAAIYYRTLNIISDIQIPLDAGDFRIIDRKVLNILNQLNEKNKFIRGLIPWIGFKQIAYEYTRQGRAKGKTKYTLSKMINLSLDGIISFSVKPLKYVLLLGMLSTLISSTLAVIYLYIKLFTDIKLIPGFSALFIANLFLFSVVFFILGIISIYLSRIYQNTQNRPDFIIEND